MTMKKQLFFCLSLLLLLTACGKSEDENPWVTQIVPEAPTTPENPSNPEETPDNPDTPIGSYEYVDLGLPSGTLWATTNIGATSPADYGDYFAWGETSPKTTYSWETYKWCDPRSSTPLTKYCTDSKRGMVDNNTVLEAGDDAATANWGSGWRMPTKEEQQELDSYCTWSWTTRTNSAGKLIKGYEIRSKSNGNSIFLPAAGYRGGRLLELAESDGCYQSSSLYSDDPLIAYRLSFNCNGHECGSYGLGRNIGFSVRPVCTKKTSER